MPDLSRKTASIYIDHAAAEQALIKLQQQADKLSASIKKGQDAGKAMVKEISKLNDSKEQIAAVQRQIDAGLKPSFNQLASLVAKTRAELKKMSESDPGFIQKTKDLNKYSTELNRLGTQIGAVQKESGGLKGMLSEMIPALGLAAAGAAVIGFFKGAIDEALEADKITRQFANTLEKAGRSDAFDRLGDAADEMAKRFKFLDNDDVTNVFDKLITYGKLTEAQIKQITPVIINFAAKSGKSLDESATTIIKALEGSGRELKEYGVNVTMAQTQSERLSAVMYDLGNKVNGAADAFGETTQGQIAGTQQSIKDLKEEIGTDLLPFIQKIYAGIAGVIGGIKILFEQTTTSMSEMIANVQAQQGKNFAKFAEDIAAEMGTKSIAEQQKLADSYKSIYISSQKALSDFLKSSNKGNKEDRDRLLAQQEQDEQIYLATQRTLQDSITTDKKNNEAAAKANADAAAKKAEEARKKAEQELQASLRRADGYRKQALDAIAKANQNEIQLLKDKYKTEADDQTKSLAERFAALASYNDAGLKLIQSIKDGQQDALDNEIATDKKKATSAAELAAIEQLRIAKQADIEKQYALSVSNFKIEVSRKYTEVATQEFKKQSDLIDKDYQHQKEIADQLAKDQLNNIGIDTDNKLLALDKAFQDGKIKNLQDYEKQRDAITRAGHQKELQQQLQQLETMQGVLQFYGFKNSDIDKKVADFKVQINKDANDKTIKDDQAALQKRMEFAQFILDSAQQVANIISTINSEKNAEDESQLAENQKRLDDNTKNLDRQLAKNLVSQKEYDRQLKALQDKKAKEDEAIKKKEFERNKQAQVIQAIMSGAQAIVSTLAARPGFTDIVSLGAFRAINIALAVATTAAQVATISKQKYAKGGLFDGPSHSEGGMPVLNPRTGKKVAEIEGGEPILSKRTYANNRELINQLLHASMYGNGERITPYWQQRPAYRPINYSGISRSMDRVNFFANGGVIQAPESSKTVSNNQQDVSYIPVLIAAIENLNANSLSLQQKLSEPVKAYTLLSDANAAQDTYDRIKRESTITR